MNGTITRDLRFEPASDLLRLPALRSTEVPTLEDAILGRRLAAWLQPLLDRMNSSPEESLALTPLGVGPAGRTVGLELSLHHAASSSCGSLVLGPALLRPCSSRSLPDPARNPLEAPGRLGRALFLHRLLGLLADLHAVGGPNLQLSTRRSATATVALFFELRWGENRDLLELHLDAPLRTLGQRLARELPRAALEVAALPASALPLSLDLELGSLSLTYPSLCALGVGDLLLLSADHGLVDQSPIGPAQLRLSPTRVARGRLTSDHLEVESLDRSRPLLEEKSAMPDTPLDAVRIDLRLRLGTVPLDLEQLAALGPGVVLPLPFRTPDVDLLVGDHEVGRGELVELDGQLAVRITARRA